MIPNFWWIPQGICTWEHQDRGIWEPQGLNPKGFGLFGNGFGVIPDPAQLEPGDILGLISWKFLGIEIQAGKPQNTLGEPLQSHLPIPIQDGRGKLRSRSWLEFPIQPGHGAGIPDPN